MKHILFYAMLFTVACGNNDSATVSQQTKKTSSENQAQATTTSSAQGDGIVGEWELVGFITDTNDNLLLDEDERKNLKTPSFKDYMKLNKDGSGLFTVAKMDGRYETKINESGGSANGKRDLTWYDKANGEHRIGTIISVTKNELQIKEPGGSGLFLWKRV